jgi:hypothetical protein
MACDCEQRSVAEAPAISQRGCERLLRPGSVACIKRRDCRRNQQVTRFNAIIGVLIEGGAASTKPGGSPGVLAGEQQRAANPEGESGSISTVAIRKRITVALRQYLVALSAAPKKMGRGRVAFEVFEAERGFPACRRERRVGLAPIPESKGFACANRADRSHLVSLTP